MSCTFTFFSLVVGLCTGIIGHTIHGSVGWAIADGIFSFIAWAKWLICQEVNVSVIRDAFSFFLN